MQLKSMLESKLNYHNSTFDANQKDHFVKTHQPLAKKSNHNSIKTIECFKGVIGQAVWYLGC